MSTTERGILEAKVLPELQAIASSMGVQGYQRLRKADLIGAIIAKAQGVEFTPSPRPSSGARGNSAAEPTLLDAAGAEAPAGDAQGDGDESGGRRRRRRRGRGEEGDGAPVGELTAAPAPPAIEGGSNGSVQQAGQAQQADAGQARQDQAATPASGERRDDGQAPAQAQQPSASATATQGEQPSGAKAQQPSGNQGEQGSGSQGEQRSGGQGDGQQSRGDGSGRQNWNQGGGGGGGRWDSGGQQSGSGRRRNRNRNRRNRFQQGDGGGVGVMERGDARGGQGGQQDDRPEVTRTGTLDIRSQDGYGFLRVGAFTPGSDDVYVPLSMIRRLGLRRGDEVEGVVKLPRDSEKYAALARVEKINERDPEEARGRREFKDLTPLYPQERLRLEHNPTEISTRIMDLMCPIGKGQRGLIVSPPKAGKTTLMKQIANAISE